MPRLCPQAKPHTLIVESKTLECFKLHAFRSLGNPSTCSFACPELTELHLNVLPPSLTPIGVRRIYTPPFYGLCNIWFVTWDFGALISSCGMLLVEATEGIAVLLSLSLRVGSCGRRLRWIIILMRKSVVVRQRFAGFDIMVKGLILMRVHCFRFCLTFKSAKAMLRFMRGHFRYPSVKHPLNRSQRFELFLSLGFLFSV